MSEKMKKTDDELMAAVRFGDPNALGLIFNRHREPLVQVALHRISNVKGKRELAEDAVQNAFVKVISMIGRDSFWVRAKGPVVAWLKMIVRQQACELLRKKSASEKTCCDLESDGSPCSTVEDLSPIQNRSGMDFQVLVRSLVSSLPRQVGQVIQMTLEGYTNKEIACQLGISLPTISRHCKLARKVIADGDFGLAA